MPGPLSSSNASSISKAGCTATATVTTATAIGSSQENGHTGGPRRGWFSRMFGGLSSALAACLPLGGRLHAQHSPPVPVRCGQAVAVCSTSRNKANGSSTRQASAQLLSSAWVGSRTSTGQLAMQEVGSACCMVAAHELHDSAKHLLCSPLCTCCAVLAQCQALPVLHARAKTRWCNTLKLAGGIKPQAHMDAGSCQLPPCCMPTAMHRSHPLTCLVP